MRLLFCCFFVNPITRFNTARFAGDVFLDTLTRFLTRLAVCSFGGRQLWQWRTRLDHNNENNDGVDHEDANSDDGNNGKVDGNDSADDDEYEENNDEEVALNLLKQQCSSI